MILKYPVISGVILGWPLLLLLPGCSQNTDIRAEPITMTVVEIQDDPSKWGCIGTHKKTLLRGDDGRVYLACNKLGNPGDKIHGCWHSGHREALNDNVYQNGFSTDTCEKN
jgi:hypothetical protein